MPRLSNFIAFSTPVLFIGLAHGQSLNVRRASDYLQVTALTPNIIRVTETPNVQIPPDPLPIVVGHFPKPKVSRSINSLETSELIVAVSPTGAVSFRDKQGKLIASEISGTRSLEQFALPKFPGVPAYHSSLSFSLSDQEAIYGLGQHQDGAMDRRGTVTVLSQTNREVAIPWFVSNQGYGILWNNASRTIVDAGGKMDANSLLDDDDKPGGLTGHYFKGTDFETPVQSRRDSKIDFDWSENPPVGLPKENYSVRWTGIFAPATTGTYSFRASADDGVRLFIDDKPVLDDWSVHPERLATGAISLEAHTRHKIRLEFFQGTRDSVIHFSWSSPGPGAVNWNSYAAKSIDYYFVYGPAISRVLETYRKLTGDAPMPPKWALGYWQSKERYKTQKEWEEIAVGYRSRHLPIDNLVQDWFYWDPHAWGSHEFDKTRYPDPAAGIAELHDKYHLHLMISVWGKFAPGSATDPDKNYQELDAKQDLYPDEVSSPERYYDAFSTEARTIYWRQIQNALFSKGIDAWWLDASEPEANLQALDESATGAGPGAFVVSGWPLMHTAGVYQGQRAANPSKRVFILTRSAFAGQQRNGAATWSGDITASWDTLAKQIPAGINFSLSGIPYWTTDIGAFFVPYPGGCDNSEYRELYTRWFEFGTFCPIFRSHGTDTPREMWRFGPKIQQILAKYDRLRYRLMPYIYSSAWRVTFQGDSIMRGLVEDFPSDPIGNRVKDEFLFGPSFLICPVITAGATERKVYLPAGSDWYDFWTDKKISGGQWIIAPAPMDQEPIYVKAGSIIPTQPDVEYTGENPFQVNVKVYPGSNASFDLYEDAGDGYGYEKGQFGISRYIWDDRAAHLTAHPKRGSYPGMPDKSVTVNVSVAKG